MLNKNDNDLQIIPFTTSEDYLLNAIRKVFNDETIEKELLAEFVPQFDKHIEKIKQLPDKILNNCRTFKYKDSKLYYIECKDNIIEEYVEQVRDTESKADQLKRLRAYIEMLRGDLCEIVYPRAYTFIEHRLNILSEGMSLDINTHFLQQHHYHLWNMYGEKLEHFLNLLYSYRDLLDGVKDFSFVRWDLHRALKDANAISEHFENKCKNVYGEEVFKIKFFEDYFQFIIQLIENSCNELFQITKDNNIKFN